MTTPDGAVLVDSGAGETRDNAAADQSPRSPAAPRSIRYSTRIGISTRSAATKPSGAPARTSWPTRRLGSDSRHLITCPSATSITRPCRSQAQPTESFYTTGSTTIGGRRIDYGYLIEAHTDGDAYVYFRDANVIAVGDAIAPERDPELDWWGGGWLGGRIDSLKQLLALTNAQTRFVPSYGAPVGRSAVQAEHDMCELLFGRFFERVRKGESNEEMLAAGIMEGTGRTWNDPAKFVHDAHKGFWGHNNTLSHDIV